MLITTAIVLLLALLFGKITFKEIKEYVRKRKDGRGNECTGGGSERGSGDRGKHAR